MNKRTHDSHYPWTKKWGADHDPATSFLNPSRSTPGWGSNKEAFEYFPGPLPSRIAVSTAAFDVDGWIQVPTPPKFLTVQKNCHGLSLK
jgi:hypothetical protein